MSVPAARLEPAPSTLIGRSVVLPSYGRIDLSYTEAVPVGPLAAGLVIVHHVVGGRWEIPQQITFTWNTSAVVADRTLGIKFNDTDGNVVGQVLMNGVQPASTSYRYTFMLDAGGSFVSGIFGIAPLPYIILPNGFTWQLIGTNLDAGDVQNGLTHTEVVIPTGPPLSAAPPTITASPVIV